MSWSLWILARYRGFYLSQEAASDLGLVTIQNGGNCCWLLPGVLHLAYSFALKSKQTSVAKVDKLCAKLAFKNVYASGTREDYQLQTCREM